MGICTCGDLYISPRAIGKLTEDNCGKNELEFDLNFQTLNINENQRDFQRNRIALICGTYVAKREARLCSKWFHGGFLRNHAMEMTLHHGSS